MKIIAITLFILQLILPTIQSPNNPQKRHILPPEQEQPPTNPTPNIDQSSSGVQNVEYIGLGWGKPFPFDKVLRRVCSPGPYHQSDFESVHICLQCGVMTHWVCELRCHCAKWIEIGRPDGEREKSKGQTVDDHDVEKGVNMDEEWWNKHYQPVGRSTLEFNERTSNVCWRYHQFPGLWHPSYQSIVGNKERCDHRCSFCNRKCHCQLLNTDVIVEDESVIGDFVLKSGDEKTFVCTAEEEIAQDEGWWCRSACYYCFHRCKCPLNHLVEDDRTFKSVVPTGATSIDLPQAS